jgi:hypothetical protein
MTLKFYQSAKACQISLMTKSIDDHDQSPARVGIGTGRNMENKGQNGGANTYFPYIHVVSFEISHLNPVPGQQGLVAHFLLPEPGALIFGHPHVMAEKNGSPRNRSDESMTGNVESPGGARKGKVRMDERILDITKDGELEGRI